MIKIQTILLMFIFVTLFGCNSFGQTVKVGETFTLKSNETAKIAEAKIEITVNRIGRQWLANGGGETLDFTFTVKQDEQTKSYSSPILEPIAAGDYQIKVVKTEPFGNGYATFLVTKKDSEQKSDVVKDAEKKDESNKTPVKKIQNDEAATSFVEQFGWHIDDSIEPVKVELEFPKTFDGLPFYHYQSASLGSNVDMTPLLGKKVEMLRYTLREKQNDKGTEFTIFAHLIIENGNVVGAWRTDSSDRTPGIYSFKKKI